MALRTAFGKGRKGRGDEENRDDRDGRGRKAADLRSAAGPIRSGGLRQAPGDAEAAEHAGADVGAAEGDQLLVGVQAVTTLGGVQSSGTQPLGQADERDGGTREGNVDEPIQRHERDRGRRQSLRHLTDDGHTAGGQVEPVRCHQPEGEDEERPGHPRQQALPDEQHRQ